RFNASRGFSQGATRYDMLNTQEYANLQWVTANNMGISPNHPIYGNGDDPIIPDFVHPARGVEGSSSVDPSLYHYADYLIARANKEGTNWFDEIYQNGIRQEYDLSVTGGTDKIGYAFSAGHLEEEGILINTGFDRVSFRSSIDASLMKWLKVGQTLNISRTQRKGTTTDNSEGGPVAFAYRIHPIIPVYDIMGNYAGSQGAGLGTAQNPVALLERSRHNYNRSVRIIGNIYSDIHL